MVSTVREAAYFFQPSPSGGGFRSATLSLAGAALGHSLGGQGVFVIAFLALALVAAVVLTAIWSGDKDRRQAGLDVLDRLTRWRW